MKIYARVGVVLFLAVCALLAGACPLESDEGVDSPLVGSWSNELTPPDDRTFTIKPDSSFSATLCPKDMTEDMRGTVTGKLVKEGGSYLMANMRETTGKAWGDALTMFTQTYIQIVLSDNDQTFELQCDDAAVITFFGGKYYKQ